MLNDTKDDGAWFVPKRFGYGAGLPIRWQGWALLLGYIALMASIAFALMPRHPGTFAAIMVAATIAIIVISARHTRGGWRWRWGKHD